MLTQDEFYSIRDSVSDKIAEIIYNMAIELGHDLEDPVVAQAYADGLQVVLEDLEG